MKDPITKTSGRALHPREAALLRHVAPCIHRVRGATARVRERADEAKRLADLADGDPNATYVKHAKNAHALAMGVRYEALETAYEALCAYLGVAPYSTEEDLAEALSRGLEVFDGGKR